MAYQTINPYTEKLVKTFNDHSDTQLEAILAKADETFKNDWSQKPFPERKAIVKKAASILRENLDEFAKLITLEMGKLFREAQEEVVISADILDYYADNAETFLAPEKLKVKEGEALIENAPLGVIFCVEPWNFPFYQLARVAGPNLMAGNTLIIKHAKNVPQCALMFEKLFLDAGAPVGVCTNVFISYEQTTKAITDKRIKGVALTGSDKAGAQVASQAGKALKKNTMELGGTDAFIVLEDADIETAVRWGVSGRTYNSGQSCIAAKRFILHEKIADAFLDRFKTEMSKLIPGDPMDPKTTLGPLCTDKALELVQKQIKAAVDGGAKILLGGKRFDQQGYFLEPTILTNITPENPVYYQEFFAPVALVFRVKDEKDAISLANDSSYGLGGSVITKDIERGKRIARQIETGMVFINRVTWSAPDLPFGGVKSSGYGRELSKLGIGEFVNKKLICIM
jgi:succinate-semialdehyde dehydrogenase/glutarate-semialdehyde dehydrogenase